MVVQHANDRLRNRRKLTKQAISFAMEGKWGEAAETNRLIIVGFPDDSEAYNRLGKAATELGLYSEARDAFSRTLELDPSNPIAKKNLQRLQTLSDDTAKEPGGTRVPPHFFIEQTGKTGLEELTDLAQRDTLAKVSTGEKVALHIAGARINATTEAGNILGRLDSRVSSRLTALMNGGNRYEGAVSSVAEDRLVIFIKETYQNPSQRGRLSFPPKGHDTTRPHSWPRRRQGSNDAESMAGEDQWSPDRPAPDPRHAHEASRGFAAFANGEEQEDE